MEKDNASALSHIRWALTVLYFTVALLAATLVCVSSACEAGPQTLRWWREANAADRAGRCAGWAVSAVADAFGAGGRSSASAASR